MAVTKQTVFFSGNEALARGAYEAGLKVAVAYPGTPSTEILEFLSQHNEIDSQWSINEKVAFEVALSAAIGGVRSLYASKHVGVNVAMDALMTSAYTGISAGFVIVSCDDPGLHSSQNEQDNRLIAKVAKIPLLEPATPREAYVYIKIAFDISEQFDTPVLVRMTTRLSHSKEDIDIGLRKEVAKRKFAVNPQKYVMVPKNAYLRHIELEKRLVRLQKFSETTSLNTIEKGRKALGFITSGVPYLYVKENYPDASFLKLGMSFPFPNNKVRKFARSVKRLVVVEELEPFLEENVQLLGIPFTAKDPTFRVGELRPDLIPKIVAGKKKKEEHVPSRKPVLCPGCTHRPVFATLKKLGVVVAGDIGCYTLAALPPLSSLHTCLCMGSGVTFFEGLSRALHDKKVVGVIGDSTFVHSGITGLINAAYNKQKGVLIILDNATTAMTGGQPHPATGITIKGEPTKKLDLETICRASGADNVDVVDPYDIRSLEALLKKSLDENALSVVIARFPCRMFDKNKKPVPDYYKEACKKCYVCLKLDCPALIKHNDGFVEIDNNLCVGCNLCVEVCPFGALKKQ